MTDEHTTDEMSPDPVPPEFVSDAQLAAEPAIPVLHALRLSTAEHDALARRIELAASAELARRAALAGSAGAAVREMPRPEVPRLVVSRGGRGAPVRSASRAVLRDVAPVLARALRPALVAAAAAALFAVGFADGESSTSTAELTGQQLSDASAIEALSLHDPSAQWPEQARAPSVDALGRAIGLGGAP